MEKSAKDIKQEMIITSILLAYFLFITIGALSYPIDARLFPMVLGIPGVIFTALTLLTSYRKLLFIRAASLEGQEETKEQLAPLQIRKEFVAFGYAIAYLVLIYFVGFMIATLLLSLAIPYFLGLRSIPKIVIFTVILLAVIWLTFPVALGLTLPKGLLGLI